MEKESNISLGGAIILLALFLQNYFLGGEKKHFELIPQHSQSFNKTYTLKNTGKTKKLTYFLIYSIVPERYKGN